MAFRRRPTQGISNILCTIRGFREGVSIVGSPHQPAPHRRTLCWPTKARAAAADAESKLCRSNCQTVFAMEEIPSDKLRRARLGRAVPLRCMFDATLAALEQTGVWSRFRRLGSHVLIAFRRHRISAPTSSRYCRFSPLVPIARCLQRWPCEPVARIDLQSRCRPKW